MIATFVRITLRLRLEKQLGVDDYFLLSSCVLLIASTGLLYWGIRAIFFTAELKLNPAAILASGLSEADMLREIVFFQKVSWAHTTLSWACIFAVKFGFFSFFRHLVDRITFMFAFWKGGVIFTGLVCAFCISDNFIACPKLGMSACKYRFPY